ncbi:unnamed protein product [Linum trigynum]|uniref:Gnk2-homologous domain-containing protein n=1 Tax=Linum trigynum TaxID=586398 RepID=A0AAV2GIT1_9ROSI
MEKSRNSLMLRWSVLPLLWFLLPGFTVANNLHTLSCSPDMYFKGDRDLKAGITAVLQNLVQNTAASNPLPTKFQYPADDPHVYGAAFCRWPDEPEACGQCLRMARKIVLHGCYHRAGAEFHNKLCYLRFEFYNFMDVTI